MRIYLIKSIRSEDFRNGLVNEKYSHLSVCWC
nr:MAG TPA: hypothetical protein [Caudoviricetes sp.]